MKRKRISIKRMALKLLCTVLGVILAVMLGFTLYFQSLVGQINHTNTTKSEPISVEDFSQFLTSLNFGSDSSEHTIIGGKNSNLVNILLIGQDRREGESQARSDTMILCTFDKETNQLTMTSFLRDLYVPIPGHASNRINAAYALGGADLLEETLKASFGLHIDGNVEVDFSQFPEIIDLLGGVSLTLRQDEADEVNRTTGGFLTEGTQLLNGEQALAYARIRKLDADGDFSRTSRQRTLLVAVMDAYKSTDFSTMLTLVYNVLPMVSTDLRNFEILTYAIELFPLLANAQITSQHIPADGTYTNSTIDGMSVLEADLEANRQLLLESLLKKTN